MASHSMVSETPNNIQQCTVVKICISQPKVCGLFSCGFTYASLQSLVSITLYIFYHTSRSLVLQLVTLSHVLFPLSN